MQMVAMVQEEGVMAIATVGFALVATDGVEGVCVDPGEKGAILEAGGPARQEGEKAGSSHTWV